MKKLFGILAFFVIMIFNVHAAQQNIDLVSAAGFGVLAATKVENTGPTVIGQDLGLSPNDGTSITGFPPGTANAIHAADAIALQAQGDLTLAYLDAEGRSEDVVIIPSGELGGLTLTPGLYRSGVSSFAISAGELTLNAEGNSSAVFIFQMPSSTLTTISGTHVILEGDADPCNIFWQVGSSATIGTHSEFQGNILALTSITVTTGANLSGRVLARNGAVTLDSNNIFSSCENGHACGDGSLDDGEQCDDGNNIDQDGCSSNCTIEENNPEIPEFTTIGAGLSLAGIGTYLYRKRNKR